jgi:DNA polymerase elongation subunit (family B)
MLSHEPKNYALLHLDGTVTLRGVAFRSSRAEPFGEKFLRQAVKFVLQDNIGAARNLYIETHLAIRRRVLATSDFAARVRLTKSPEQYLAVRARRRELPYEAMLANGRRSWSVGTRAYVYRMSGGRAGLVDEREDNEHAEIDAKDYDVEYYLRLLRDTYASRLVRAFTPEVYQSLIADPDQRSLFEHPLDDAHPILNVHRSIPSDGDSR